MRKFTKVVLILAGILLAIAISCLAISFALGYEVRNIEGMIQTDKFPIYEKDTDTEANSSMDEVVDACSELDIEFGVGVLEVKYADVEKIEVAQLDGSGFRYYVKGDTLYVKGGVKAGMSSTEGRLLITIPNGHQFQKVDLELGAGSATIGKLNAKDVDVEVGTGKLNLTLDGSEKDYNYELECGVGSIRIGEAAYQGIGCEKEVRTEGATKHFDVEVGAGEIKIKFTGGEI